MHPGSVVVVGAIGAGKTTLLREVGTARPEFKLIEERRGTYVDAFYHDPSLAFLNQVDYAAQFVNTALCAARAGRPVIQERCAWDTHFVFSALMRERGLLTGPEFDVLGELVLATDAILVPSHVVLIDVPGSVLRERIHARGHRDETRIDDEYLDALLNRYDAWFRALGSGVATLRIDAHPHTPAETRDRVLEWLEATGVVPAF